MCWVKWIKSIVATKSVHHQWKAVLTPFYKQPRIWVFPYFYKKILNRPLWFFKNLNPLINRGSSNYVSDNILQSYQGCSWFFLKFPERSHPLVVGKPPSEETKNVEIFSSSLHPHFQNVKTASPCREGNGWTPWLCHSNTLRFIIKTSRKYVKD